MSIGYDYCPFKPGTYGTSINAEKPIIAPFYSDLTLESIKNSPPPALLSGLFVRGVTKTDVVDRATSDVNKYLKSNKFYATWVHVTTWYRARAWGKIEVIYVHLCSDLIYSLIAFVI